MSTPKTSIVIRGLSISTDTGYSIIDDVTVAIGQGEIVGLVGESGAGKSSVGLALLGFNAPGTQFDSGELQIADEEIDIQDADSMLGKRGAEIAYVPQEPGMSLNPAVRVGDAISRMRKAHGLNSGDSEVARLLRTVSLPSSKEFSRRYPHQLSGGQQQRLCLAIGLACDPKVLVLDEITTGLDVVTQEAILREVELLAKTRNVGIVYITHDLAVVASVADRIIVMYSGEVVESGPTDKVLRASHHPYTKALIQAAPNHSRPSVVKPIRGIVPSLDNRPKACQFADRCDLATELCRTQRPAIETVSENREVRCYHWAKVTPAASAIPREIETVSEEVEVLLSVDQITASHKTRMGKLTVARDISFDVREGQCVALVGESGSGKTTVARSIIGLHHIDSGSITLMGEAVPSKIRHRTVEQRRELQFIFQNPRASLNPHQTVADIVSRPLRLLRNVRGAELDTRMRSLLDEVRLPASSAQKYPRELSGGERQRVSIARALAAEPKVLICDEVTSALDVSVQAAVIELLRTLSAERGLGMLMITHDLGVVASIAHEVLVLQQGDICERGSVEQILHAPAHPYTKALLEAAPLLASHS